MYVGTYTMPYLWRTEDMSSFLFLSYMINMVYFEKKNFFFQTDEDGKTILNLENSNKSLSGELREVKKDLGQLQENLEVSENMNLQFENQLNKTLRNLSTVMDDIHTVLKKVR